MNTPDYKLTSNDTLTKLAKSIDIQSWHELIEFVKNLPYGRTSNRTDLSLVLLEKKGTCSSKHALLKKIADANNIPNIALVLGIFKMNQTNTPDIGTELMDNAIAYIPEAHCYLKIDGEYVDITTKTSEFKDIEQDIIEEQVIKPEDVFEFKINYQKAFIKNWLKGTNSTLTFEQMWQIREQCIANRSK